MRRQKDKPPVYTPDCTSLQLRIHVLGYYPRGESILVVLYDTMRKCVLQSILIDCYEVNNINRFEKLLNEYNLHKNKLTYFIWTHPDEDHSVGIPDLIKKYVDKRSLIFVPCGLSRDCMNLKRLSLKSILTHLSSFTPVLKSFVAVMKCSRMRPSIVDMATASSNSILPDMYGEIYKDGYEKTCDFLIEFLTPIKNKVFTKTITNTSFLKNDISISFNLKFGNKIFFFGGDAEDESLKEIKPNRWENTVFVKIPHHGSTTSQLLPTFYDDALARSGKNTPRITAVTTSFENDSNIHLPEKTVLDKYKSSARGIYVTKNKGSQINNFGIWTFVYGYNKGVLSSISFEGDKEVYYENLIKPGRKKNP